MERALDLIQTLQVAELQNGVLVPRLRLENGETRVYIQWRCLKRRSGHEPDGRPMVVVLDIYVIILADSDLVGFIEENVTPIHRVLVAWVDVGSRAWAFIGSLWGHIFPELISSPVCVTRTC